MDYVMGAVNTGVMADLDIQGSALSDDQIDLGVLPDLLGYNLRSAQLALQRSLSKAIPGGDPGSGIFGLLVLCAGNPGISQIQVARHLTIDKASVVALVDRGEESGWLQRRRAPDDRRRHGLFITPDGNAHLAQMKSRMRACEQSFDALYAPEERQQLLTLLQRIRP